MSKRLLAATAAALVCVLVAPAAAGSAPSQAKFQLAGTAQDDIDPENAVNEVISMNTAVAPFFGAASRDVRTKVHELDNEIQLKYFFVAPHTCGVGTPRIFLRIDRDGDGRGNGNAFGYVGLPPQFGPCVTGKWLFEDLTDELPRWDLTQFGGPFYNTWSEVEAFFAGDPAHEVLRGGLVDDTSNLAVGKVYFDNVTVGNRTIEAWEDTAG